MQSGSSGSPVFLLFAFVCSVAIYVFYCYCLKRIVEKCGEEPGVVIWIPILQMIPLFRIAKMNPWLILLTLVPLVNLIVVIMVWIKVLNALGRDGIMVLLVLFLGFIYIPYLALSSDKRTAPKMA